MTSNRLQVPFHIFYFLVLSYPFLPFGFISTGTHLYTVPFRVSYGYSLAASSYFAPILDIPYGRRAYISLG